MRPIPTLVPGLLAASRSEALSQKLLAEYPMLKTQIEQALQVVQELTPKEPPPAPTPDAAVSPTTETPAPTDDTAAPTDPTDPTDPAVTP